MHTTLAQAMETLLEVSRGHGGDIDIVASLRHELSGLKDTVRELQAENEQLRRAAGGTHSPVPTPKEEVVAVGTPASHPGDKCVGDKRKGSEEVEDACGGQAKRHQGLPSEVVAEAG